MGRYPQMRRRPLTAGAIAVWADAPDATRNAAESGETAREARVSRTAPTVSSCPCTEMPSRVVRGVLRPHLQADARRLFADGTRFLQTVRLGGTSPAAAARLMWWAPARPARSAGGALPAVSL